MCSRGLDTQTIKQRNYNDSIELQTDYTIVYSAHARLTFKRTMLKVFMMIKDRV